MSRTRKLGSSAANNALRQATVHLEEAAWQARNGSCAEAVDRLSEGSIALGGGLASGGKAQAEASGILDMHEEALEAVDRYCVVKRGSGTKKPKSDDGSWDYETKAR